jgi:hypothetical protein
MQTASDPVKVFDRTPNLQGAQIISYRVSPDDKWSVLIGITAGAPERCAPTPYLSLPHAAHHHVLKQ